MGRLSPSSSKAGTAKLVVQAALVLLGQLHLLG
jgi:hypothetical protein